MCRNYVYDHTCMILNSVQTYLFSIWMTEVKNQLPVPLLLIMYKECIHMQGNLTGIYKWKCSNSLNVTWLHCIDAVSTEQLQNPRISWFSPAPEKCQGKGNRSGMVQYPNNIRQTSHIPDQPKNVNYSAE